MAQEGAQRLGDEGVLCLGVPVAPLDPLAALPQLPQRQDFTWVWDGWPGLTLAATGVEHSLELRGPRRFALAQRFIDTSLSRLVCPHPTARAGAAAQAGLSLQLFWPQRRRRGTRGHHRAAPLAIGTPGAPLLAPASAHPGRECHGPIHGGSPLGAGPSPEAIPPLTPLDLPRLVARSDAWQRPFQRSVQQALDLIHNGELCKLVLAAQQELLLSNPLNPVEAAAQLAAPPKGQLPLSLATPQ